MRHDLFYSRKSVHVKLTKESHAALREKLFRYGITMQDLFQEAADMALSESPKAERLLQRVAKKKLMATIEKTNKHRHLRIGELDSETLYNLLEDSNDRPNESTEDEE